MKKVIVLVGILITVLIIIAIILLNVIQGNNTIMQGNVNKNEGPSNITETQSKEYEENLRLSPANLSKAMQNYQGQVTKGMLEKDLYKLVVKNIPYIYERTKLLTQEQIAEYYDQYTEEINNMNIYSKNEFVNISEDIISTITEKNKSEMPKPLVELTTCENIVDNYSFELILRYSDTNIIRLKIILSNSDERLEYQKYDALKDIFLKYSGPVTKQEITSVLDTFQANAKLIYEKSKDLPLNKILQYYDLNKTELLKLNIYNNRDYLDITNQIVRVTWLKNPEYIGFTAKDETLKSNETYTSFQVNLNYTTDENIKLIVNVINSNDLINNDNPKIKITAEIKEESE